MEPLKFNEIRKGMTLWDNDEKRLQKVLRVYLWEEMISENPNRYYKKNPENSRKEETTCD